MTPRSSVRAAAREIYAEMAKGQGVNALLNTPLPSPPPQGGREQTEQGAGSVTSAPDLTAKARELYEGSAVPIAEIARLCGVTERTIYKYAAKQSWKPRYRWTPDGTRPVAFAPAKGAGGRFIRRADKGKRFARGLKATDAAGRLRAASRCAKAARLAREAQAEAERARRAEAVIAAIGRTNRAADKLIAYRDACRKNPARANDTLLDAYHLSLDAAIDSWRAARAEADAAEAPGFEFPARARR